MRDRLLERGVKYVEVGYMYETQGYLKRCETVNLNAFLQPILYDYFRDITSHFDKDVEIRVMKSSGGFAGMEEVKAAQMLLSGPAGGLIGYAAAVDSFQAVAQRPIKSTILSYIVLIGMDMGGTSTDVSRLADGKYETKYTFQCAGVEICTPHLSIETIAAGGGSRLTFCNGMYVVGPQSVGSKPGPVCYGVGSTIHPNIEQLALTDANLFLNRLDIQSFPRVFGADGSSPLNLTATRVQFQRLTAEINKESGSNKSIWDVAEGYIEVANELMARSARRLLSLGSPDALVMFGSAGGQHCCDLAHKLGIEHIFMHKYSGVLSAYGLSQAPSIRQEKIFLGIQLDISPSAFSQLKSIIEPKLNGRVEVAVGYTGTTNYILLPFT